MEETKIGSGSPAVGMIVLNTPPKSTTVASIGGALLSDEWFDRPDHPLMNNLILSTLFEFMRGKDLKECRLVSRQWCVLSLPSARSKFHVKLNGSGPGNRGSVTDFVEVFQENKLGIPFDKYYLDPFRTTEGPGEKFLQICGSTAKSVSLTKFTVTFEVDDISALLRAMPNIEYFGISLRLHSRSGNTVKLFPDDSSTTPALNFLNKLVVYNRNDDKTSECCPTFIEDLLSISPNISDFEAVDFKIRTPDKSIIGQVLKSIEKFGRASVITNMSFVKARIEHFESLRRLAENGLRLKYLDFILEEKNEDSFKFLPQLATLFQNSIEQLVVDEICPGIVQLPYMPKLEKLEFHISEDFDTRSVNLNKLLPSLKELHLFCGDDDDELEWAEFLPNTEPCPSVKSLSIHRIALKLPLFDHILNIFPKLTGLTLDVKTDGLQILRKIMTQVTHLKDLAVSGTIEGIESIDAFLTGIPVQNVQELQYVVAELKKMTVQLRAETIRHYRTQNYHLPSIANLTNLKRLYLDIAGIEDDGDDDEPVGYTRMTDVFLYFGLYSMKHINRLEIINCEFTKTSCEILTVEMGLKSWSIANADHKYIIPNYFLTRN